MEKKDAINRIVRCARQYEENLAERNLLFVFECNKRYDAFVAHCYRRNFLHLTGVKPIALTSIDFYGQAYSGNLNERDLKPISSEAEKKLSILSNLMEIHKSAKMLGMYNFSGKELYTEQIIGNVTACLGFCRDELTGQFVPNTALKGDIRDLVKDKPFRVAAIYRKTFDEVLYSELCSSVKDYDIKALPMSVKQVLSNSLLPPEEQFYEEDYDEWYEQEQTDGIGLC